MANKNRGAALVKNAEIQQGYTARVEDARRRFFDSMVTAIEARCDEGDVYAEAKAGLKHGGYGEWLESIGVTTHYASECVRFAGHRAELVNIQGDHKLRTCAEFGNDDVKRFFGLQMREARAEVSTGRKVTKALPKAPRPLVVDIDDDEADYADDPEPLAAVDAADTDDDGWGEIGGDDEGESLLTAEQRAMAETMKRAVDALRAAQLRIIECDRTSSRKRVRYRVIAADLMRLQQEIEAAYPYADVGDNERYAELDVDDSGYITEADWMKR